MGDNSKPSSMPVGGSSMLMIFIVLCLTAFAVISFISAKNDYNLSAKTAESVTMYYLADSKAENDIKDIFDILESSTSKESFVDAIELSGMSAEIQADGKILVSYTEPIKDTMDLQASVSVDYDGKDISIVSWKSVSSYEYTDEPSFLELFN